MKTLFIYFALLLIPLIGLSQDYETAGSGGWNEGSTWVGGTPPPIDGSGNNFTIIINQNHEIQLDGSFYFKNQIGLIVCGTLIVGDNFGQDHEETNLEGNALYLEVCCGATLIINGTLTLKNVGVLNINGTFIVDGIYGHQANSGNCIYTEFPECEGSISTHDGEVPPIEEFQFGEEDDCMTGISPILPIELISFELLLNQNFVEIKWITASEINNDYFTIKRSKNGFIWETIGTVNGSGTTNEVNQYSLIDYNPYNGVNYYKLKQTDFDGQFEIFEPKVINIPTTSNYIRVYSILGILLWEGTISEYYNNKFNQTVIILDEHNNRIFVN